MIASSEDSITASNLRLTSRRLPAVADVSGDLRGANHHARVVVNRRDGEGNGNERSVLAQANRVEVRDRLAGSDVREDHVLLGLPIRRNNHPDRLADGFRGGVAEHGLGRAVP